MVRQLLAQGLLAVQGEYQTLALTETSADVLRGQRQVMLRRDAPMPKAPRRRAARPAAGRRPGWWPRSTCPPRTRRCSRGCAPGARRPPRRRASPPTWSSTTRRCARSPPPAQRAGRSCRDQRHRRGQAGQIRRAVPRGPRPVARSTSLGPCLSRGGLPGWPAVVPSGALVVASAGGGAAVAGVGEKAWARAVIVCRLCPRFAAAGVSVCRWGHPATRSSHDNPFIHSAWCAW